MQWLVDEGYPEAAGIRVVLDNLNTHTLASLYEAFAPEEARRLARRLEFHYTPKHGSWLNMAEMELSLLSRQCLDRRIPAVPRHSRLGGDLLQESFQHIQKGSHLRVGHRNRQTPTPAYGEEDAVVEGMQEEFVG
jgi:hypothetical protein